MKNHVIKFPIEEPEVSKEKIRGIIPITNRQLEKFPRKSIVEQRERFRIFMRMLMKNRSG